MARSIRIEYEGAYYHVMARGNRGESIVGDDEDREQFVRVLADACERTGWRVHAWVLMSNHYHLFIETPEANLVSGMGWLQNTYTRRHNVKHARWGRLFGDRYKAILVEGKRDRYYETLMDYIHLNPVRAGCFDVRAGASVRDYQWSSVARGYAQRADQRPAWMACDAGLGAFGYGDTVSGRRQMVERLDARARAEDRRQCGVADSPDGSDKRRSNLREGWYWGNEAFAEKVLDSAKGELRKERSVGYRSAQEHHASGELGAEKIVGRGLKSVGMRERDLPALPGSDRRKVEIAIELRAKTTVSLKWISERLFMTSEGNVAQALFKARRKEQASDMRVDVSK